MGHGLNGQGRGRYWALGTSWGKGWDFRRSAIRNRLEGGRFYGVTKKTYDNVLS